MYKYTFLHISKNAKSVLLLSLIITFTLVFLCPGTSAEPENPPLTTQQKLDGISEEEKKVLENLFNLTQEVKIAEEEEASLSLEIDAISRETKNCEEIIKNEEAAYSRKQEGLKQVLRTYQRMGPGTYLEIILDSDSLSSFLQRINTLRDLTRNTGRLLEELEESRDKLSLEKKNLNEKLAEIKEKEQQARESLGKKLQLKQKQEDYLASLNEEREFYQEHLQNIQKMVEELKPFLANAANEFAGIVKSGNLHTEDFKISFTLTDIKGSINDKVLNNIISKQPGLPKMVLAFHPGKVEINFPDKSLVITGNFIIEDGHRIKFQAEEGRFYELPLEAGYIKELFGESGLSLDLEAIIGKISLKSIETKDGYIEMSVKLGS